MCLAPELLHSVACGEEHAKAGADRLQSLRAFLAAHGQHVRKMDLRADEYGGPAVACMEECSKTAAASLQHLAIEVGGLGCTAWLPQHTALTAVKLDVSLSLALPPALSQLAALADLDVVAHEPRLGGPLPPGLTRLRLVDSAFKLALPAQVRAAPCTQGALPRGAAADAQLCTPGCLHPWLHC